ncbi:MAG TPA: Spy/CpxP family protein refolding chaperone [Noviherbaspirillum sp.]|uniref:Spy/CpxP family protein refolding chaperone n=1 Tax=Noviherbaspirillum sp. TaxID=1926288 RepID=UPI002D527B1C|nr:Spy/CpxP family protein refolding chaperone [Noviherbaspirillum sp.]HYD95788.1 Spy/CpxP family protein refolding chaperone [Noviherbaspirillum sp.]
MKTLRKRFLAGLIAAGIGAASFGALAADCGPMGAGPAGFGGGAPERMKARIEKRQTELHGKLKLNANQEAAWKAFTAKMAPPASIPRPDRAEIEKLPAPERMERMLGFMQQGEKHLADRIAATKEFYAVLTPEQQKIFDEEFRFGRGGMHHGRRH